MVLPWLRLTLLFLLPARPLPYSLLRLLNSRLGTLLLLGVGALVRGVPCAFVDLPRERREAVLLGWSQSPRKQVRGSAGLPGSGHCSSHPPVLAAIGCSSAWHSRGSRVRPWQVGGRALQRLESGRQGRRWANHMQGKRFNQQGALLVCPGGLEWRQPPHSPGLSACDFPKPALPPNPNPSAVLFMFLSPEGTSPLLAAMHYCVADPARPLKPAPPALAAEAAIRAALVDLSAADGLPGGLSAAAAALSSKGVRIM